MLRVFFFAVRGYEGSGVQVEGFKFQVLSLGVLGFGDGFLRCVKNKQPKVFIVKPRKNVQENSAERCTTLQDLLATFQSSTQAFVFIR